MKLELTIGLPGWILQDGNYDDFVVGTNRRFAIEFYAEKELNVQQSASTLERIEDSEYRGTGIIRFTSPECWIVDWGGILAYREDEPPQSFACGNTVGGQVYLGVDPFFYLEELHSVKGIPPLIYEWQIVEILKDLTPFIHANHPRVGPVLVRDRSRRQFLSVMTTKPTTEERGYMDFLLRCTLCATPPSHRFNGVIWT